MDKLVPIVVLIILVLIIAIIVVKTLRKNNKTNKENFNVNPMANSEVLNLDNLLDAFKKPKAVSEMVASSSLEEGIKSIQTSIDVINKKVINTETEIENLKKKEQLPKGSIMLWFKEGNPNTNWVPCDGATYFVQYEDGTTDNGVQVPDFRGKFVKGVGGDASTFNSGGYDILTEKHIPKHRHPLSGSENDDVKFPKLNHTHTAFGDYFNYFAGYRIPITDAVVENSLPNTRILTSTSFIDTNKSIQDLDTSTYSLSAKDAIIAKHNVGKGPIYTDEQQKFEPKYQEAKFIYYLGNLKVKPQVTIEPPASGVSQKGVVYAQENP